MKDTQTDDCGLLIIISVIILLIALASCRSKKETLHTEYARVENTQSKDSTNIVSVSNEQEYSVSIDKSQFDIKVTERYLDSIGMPYYERQTDYSQHNDNHLFILKDISDSSNIVGKTHTSKDITEDIKESSEVTTENNLIFYIIAFGIICIISAFIGIWIGSLLSWFKSR